MGLKTTNYTIKKLGIQLQTAYAILKKIKITNNRGEATFAIQVSRDNAENLEPIETVSTVFEFKRNENPVETAYNTVKGEKYEECLNEETGEFETMKVKQALYGWVDDIV